MRKAGNLKLADSELEQIKGAAANGTLSKLASGDWTTLLELGLRQRYEHGTPIVTEGDRDVGVSFVAGGEVRIERAVGDKTVEIARLANGGVFGEMSFLDKAGASASVVADGSVDVIHIRNEDIEKLIDGDPAFGSRFYHSLAITLSSRLRATNRIVRGLG